jgi:predicted N-acetyltransferase YhbS
MKITIRSEQVKNYPQIAEINVLAFSKPRETGNIGKAEMVLVDMLRHAPNFDPDLALVAEVGGRVVGYALFYPCKVLLSGQEVQATSLHPLAVHPHFQRQGLGSKLMDEAHRRLKEKGYLLSFLYGEPDYYPRFGYLPGVFGRCHVVVKRQHISPMTSIIEERQIESEDVEQIIKMWHTWFDDVPFAIFPGAAYLDWVSHINPVQTSVIIIDGELRGFLRYHPEKPDAVRFFLAKDEIAAGQLLSYLNQKYARQNIDVFPLPVHPAAAARQWLPSHITPVIEKWQAGMIKILDEKNKIIRAYCADVVSGRQAAGLLVYPPFLDGAW